MIDDANQHPEHGRPAIGAPTGNTRVGPMSGNRAATEKFNNFRKRRTGKAE